MDFQKQGKQCFKTIPEVFGGFRGGAGNQYRDYVSDRGDVSLPAYSRPGDRYRHGSLLEFLCQ